MPVYDTPAADGFEAENLEELDFDPVDLEVCSIQSITFLPEYPEDCDDILPAPQKRQYGANVDRNCESAPRMSDMLALIAGPFAKALAEIDPFPHSQMMSISKCHLHLLAFLLANGMEPSKAKAIVMETRGWPGKKVSGLPGKGLTQRMSLPLWDIEAYQALAACLACNAGKRFLNQSQIVTPDHPKLFVSLPNALRTASFARNFHVAEEAEMLMHAIELFSAANMMNDSDQTKLSKAPDRRAIFVRLNEIIEKRYCEQSRIERHGPLLNAPLLPNYRQILSNKELALLGCEFRNCLSNYQEELLEGEIAFLIRNGSPCIVIGIKPDISGGYSFWQMDAPRGDDIKPDLRVQIFDELLQMSIVTNGEWKSELENISRGFRALARQGQDQTEAIRRNAIKCQKSLIAAQAALKWTSKSLIAQVLDEQ